MDYIDRFKNRLTRNGNENVGETYANNTISFIESTFSASPTFRLLEVTSSEFPEIKKIDARVVAVERMGTLKQVLFRPYQGLNIGAYVKFDNYTWLIFDQWGDRNSIKYTALVEKCNRTLKWKDVNGDIKEIDCIASQTPIGSKSRQDRDGIEFNKYDVSLPMGQLYVFVEKNELTASVEMNQRFIFGERVYEISGIDDISFVDKDGYGLMQLLFKITTKQDADDFVNGIAFNEHPTIINSGDGGVIW